MCNLKRRIVQFHHFGPEHLVDEAGVSFKPDDACKIVESHKMPWNDGQHRRKFIRSNGTYIDSNGEKHNGDINFWGEWEGISSVYKIEYPNGDTGNDYPKYIHKPAAERMENYARAPYYKPDFNNPKRQGWQNTDPYVFGKHFIYSNCQQHKYSSLRQLAPGSIIVMGSKKGVFCIDTVLVIAKPLCKYSRNNLSEVRNLVERGVISETFWETTIMPLMNGKCGEHDAAGEEIEYTLYCTASYDEPYEGMYSFFPCKPYESGKGFKRIPVQYKDYFSPNLGIGIKRSGIVSLEEAKACWENIRQQVLHDEQGLFLGVYAEEPRLP